MKDLDAVPWPITNGVDVELWVKRGPRRITIIDARTHDNKGEIINGKYIKEE